MTQPQAPSDQSERDLIRHNLDENLFVEAGAGTGKTTALVSRVVALIASAKLEMAGLAAITFTEAAAAELRERIRRELDDEARNPGRDPRHRERCRRASREMELASIQTLHSFALALLRELPIEAGLPPGFETLDPIQADLAFREAWDEWLGAALDSGDLGQLIFEAMRLGLKLVDLQNIAQSLHADYDLVQDVPVPLTLRPSLTVTGELAAAAPAIRRLLPLARNGADDPLNRHSHGIAELADRLTRVSDGEAIALLAGHSKLDCRLGSVNNWQTDPDTGSNGCTSLKQLLAGLEETRSTELGQLRESLLTRLLESIRKFVVSQVDQRKTDGRAEFHDCLVWARDLLKNNLEASRRFQRRYQYILIDEFQDTDPIQAEIAFFLAEDPDGITHSSTRDWQQVNPVPGKLFVVADPKQSIYRFRRADIAALDSIRDHLGGRLVPLVQNFRSHPGIIRWTNHVFGRWMDPGPAAAGHQRIQADYQQLTPWLQLPDTDPPLGVHRIGGVVQANAQGVRREEAEAVAALVRSIRADGWQVRDPGSGEMRAASYRDICFLIRTRTGLDILENALESAEIPFRIESESIVLNTEDVRELLNCLRAIDSPGDQVALVAALRSTAFACSDVELLQFADSGGRFDYIRPGPASGPVADALKVLHDFHLRRAWAPPDNLTELFIRDRRMVELSFGRRRPRERWRRLELVVEQAGAFRETGGGSLRKFLDWMDQQVAENARTVEVPVPETDEDCVRIMTTHAAKGLEFPIVILPGLGSQYRHQPGPLVINRESGVAESRISDGARPPGYFQTSGFQGLNELESSAGSAEQVRLLYVACTRARDHLVLSLFRSDQRSSGCPAEVFEAHCADFPHLWRETGHPGPVAALPVAPLPQPTALSALAASFDSDRQEWRERRGAAIEQASRLPARAVTAITRDNKEQAHGGEVPYRRGRGSDNLGRAVHAVLQTIDLSSGDGLSETCRVQAAAEGIRDRTHEVETLAANALSLPPVRDLQGPSPTGTPGYYREVFVSAPLNGQLVEGFIDLLIDAPDGLAIVDYKTDDVSSGTVNAKAAEYETQVGLYAWAVRQTTGRPVREVYLLFLRPNVAYRFTGVDRLVTNATAAVIGTPLN